MMFSFILLLAGILYYSYCLPPPPPPQKDELDDIPIELSKVQSVKVRYYHQKMN